MENTDALFETDRLGDGRHSDKTNRGERAVEVMNGGVHIPEQHDEDQDASENTPLIARDEEQDDWPQGKDFADLPAWQRPSILWVLPPFFLTTLAFGGIIAPKTTLMTDLACRDYLAEQTIADPAFWMTPIDYGGGGNKQCRIPQVQSRVSYILLAMTLIGGILSAIVAPQLGKLSDRYGRKPLLVVASIGTMCAEVISIFAATNPETFPVYWFYIGAALDGLFGSFTVAIAIAHAYAVDCTKPALRNVAFAMFHAALFTGLALGPIVAAGIIHWSGNIVSIFYTLLGVHMSFCAFVLLVVPESLSKKRQLAARDRHDATKKTAASMLNTLAPLKIFWPTGPGTSSPLRWNLVLLAAVDTIAFGVAMGTINIILIYLDYRFGFDTTKKSIFMSVVNGARVLTLMGVLPLLTALFRNQRSKKTNSGSDLFDLSMIRVAMFFDTLGYLGYTLARSGGLMFVSGAVASIGGIGSPTLQAALTKHTPNDRTGELLGASGLLHALARVVAPIVFSTIYAKTVETFPQTVFVCLTATFGVAFGLSWFIRPHVHWDDIAAEQRAARGEDGTTQY